MKVLKYLLLIGIFQTTYSSASQCIPSSANNNKLIKNSYSFNDTSPIFKNNRLVSYKPGLLDIETDAYSIGYYGNKITLTGNTWKMLKLTEDYQATPNTVLEFEFRSTGAEAQLNGVSPKTKWATGFHSDHFYQVHGTMNNHN